MKQINTFGMSAMTIGSCSDFHSRVSKFVETATPAALHIDAQAPAYTEAVATLASIVNRERAYITTEALREADVTRDRSVGVITRVISAYTTSPVEKKRSAAVLLHAKMSPYRGIGNHEYTKETAEVRGMLAMLDKEKESVTTLALTEEVEALREANTTFDTQYYSRATEAGARKEQSTVTSAAAVEQANTLYQEIVQIVNAYAIVQPSDELTTFIDNVNGVVAAYARIASGTSSTGKTSASGTPSTGKDTQDPSTGTPSTGDGTTEPAGDTSEPTDTPTE